MARFATLRKGWFLLLSLMAFKRLFGCRPAKRILLDVSGKLPTYPSPRPILTITSHLGQNVGLGEGQVGSFPDV